MAEALSSQAQTDQAASQYTEAVENSILKPPVGYVVNSHESSYGFRDGFEKYRSLLDSLEQAFSKPLFCCGGNLQLPNMDKFVLEVEHSWKYYELANIPLEELLQYCKPAPFGDLREMKTVLDPEVRLAYELESNRFKIKEEYTYKWASVMETRLNNAVPGSEWITKRIEDTLAPGRNVNFDLYKLNIYDKGGFFKAHVDSPSGSEMIGTLVICLPSPHKGGELCVNHDGLQHVFDFSKHSEDKSKIQWAAFYSDCIHEVKPVVEGHRVTVTYNITLRKYHKRRCSDVETEDDSKDPDSADEHFEVSAEDPSIITKALANVNIELEKMRHQGRNSPSQLGILLKHKYISKGLQADFLKGEDKVLFDYLVEKQWKCKLMSVVSRYKTKASYYDDEEHWERYLEESHQIFEFFPFSVSYPRSPPSLSSWHQGTDYRQWHRVGIPFVDIYRKVVNGDSVVRNKPGEGDWLGNEIEDVGADKIYLDSAVIVHFR